MDVFRIQNEQIELKILNEHPHVSQLLRIQTLIMQIERIITVTPLWKFRS